MSISTMGDFQVVRKKRGKNKFNYQSSSKIPNSDNDVRCIDIDRVLRNVKVARETIISTDFYLKVKGDVEHATKMAFRCDCLNTDDHSLATESHQNISEIVSYGLGNFAECIIARYQLALLIALREDLKVPQNNVSIYDPKFFKEEKEVLSKLGFDVLTENEEGKRECKENTLFFMPHCGKSLYNNLLWANWNPSHLCHLIVIGNSFSNIVQNCPSRMLRQYAPLILKIEPYKEEIPFPDSFQYSDIFNDTAIHFFQGHKLLALPGDFWSDCPDPVYDREDLEFIPK